MLLKTQRNQLIEILQNSGIDSGQFRISGDDNRFQLIVDDGTSDQYYFKLEKRAFPFQIKTRPGTDTPTFEAYEERWDAVISHFIIWARLVRREIDAPDIWAQIQQNVRLFTTANTSTDDKFTRTELAAVQGQLRLLQQSFTTAALPEAARQKLIELTAAATVKAENLTKKDWQNWIIGGFVSSITALALNPTQAQEVLRLVKAAFGGLFLH